MVVLKFYGGRESRTPDLQIANLSLYQLSYTPVGAPNIDFGNFFGKQMVAPLGKVVEKYSNVHYILCGITRRDNCANFEVFI